MGRYTGIVEQLPKVVDTTPEYQARVNQFKDEIRDRAPAALAAAFVQLRLEEMALKVKASWLALRKKAYQQLIDEVFEATGVDRIVLGNGVGIGSNPQPHLGFEPEVQIFDTEGNLVETVHGKEAFRRYCLDRGLEGEMHLAWGTANGIMKQALLDGEPLPPGVKPWQKPKISVTGLKGLKPPEDAQDPPEGTNLAELVRLAATLEDDDND